MSQYQYGDLDDLPKPNSQNVDGIEQPAENASSPQNSNLFTVLDRGDTTIQKARSQAIILVGLTRNGKSTTFNWLLNIPMIGVSKDEANDSDTYYVNIVKDDETSAQIGDSFSSVTLVPNLFVDFTRAKKTEKKMKAQETNKTEKELEYQAEKSDQDETEGVSLIDMAGYEDKRNYIGVIGVSYFLKEVFEKVKKAKFVIVISEDNFSDSTGQGIVKVFLGFFSMFNYKQMVPQVRKKLRKSIVVLITKANSTKDYYYNKLKQIFRKIRDPKFSLEDKDPILEMIYWLYNSERIEIFKAACPKKSPEECTFIKTQSEKEKEPWKFFNMNSAQKIMNKSPIGSSFKKDFEGLKENQVQQFNSAIDKRLKSYEAFVQILATFINQFTQNWKDFLETYEIQPETSFEYTNFRPVFDKIKEYNQVNDRYPQNSLRDFQFKATHRPASLMQSIKSILKIYQQSAKIEIHDHIGFQSNMNFYSSQFPLIIEGLKIFALTQQDHQMLHRLNYILKRGLKQFKRLYELNGICVGNANVKIRDYFLQIQKMHSANTKKSFVEIIIRNMKPQLIQKLFPNISSLQQYEEFFAQNEGIFQQSDQIFLREHKRSIEMAKANLLLSLGEKEKVLLCYIRVYYILEEIADLTQSLHYSEAQNTQSRKKIFMDKLELIAQIIGILRIIPQEETYSPTQCALHLCQYSNMTEQVCQIYQQLINSPTASQQKRIALYSGYAEYIADWGRIDQAIVLFQKKMKLVRHDYNEYFETMKTIKKMNSEQGRKAHQSNFNKNIHNMIKMTQSPATSKLLNQLLLQIQIRLQSK